MPTKKSHIHYHRDGTVWAKGTLRGKKMDGYWEWFRKDGMKMRSGHFDNGVQIGEWITYDKKGKKYNVTYFSEFPKISAPALRALANAKIKTLKDLSKWSEKEILELHGMGPSTIPKLRSALKAKKLVFRK